MCPLENRIANFLQAHSVIVSYFGNFELLAAPFCTEETESPSSQYLHLDLKPPCRSHHTIVSISINHRLNHYSWSTLVSAQFNFPKEEEKIIAFWKEIDAFQTSLKLSEGRPEFTFYDGPPFATGLPHYGHLLAGTIKVSILLSMLYHRSI